MMPPDRYAKQAFQHIKYLVETVGPRPAGSDSENKAFCYIANQLTHFGYQVNSQRVQYAPIPRFQYIPLLIGVLIPLGSILLANLPVLALIILPIIFAIPQLSQWVTWKRKRSQTSKNIFCCTKPEKNDGGLLICAHVDTARANAIKNHFLLWLYANRLFAAQRFAIAITFFAVLILFGFKFPGWVYQLLVIFGSIFGFIWIILETYSQLGRPIRYTTGANDNASGVGVLLSIAEEIINRDYIPIKCIFLFTGAEETGLHGARSFLEQNQNHNIRAVLNLDMVGVGDQIKVVTKDGTTRPYKTDHSLNRRIHFIEPDVNEIWYITRSGDYLPFLQSNIPATTIQTGGTKEAELKYHTVHDGLEIIDLTALAKTSRLVIRFIETYPEKF